ncbi:MAG: pantoate--beta-alanine ligase [bacterium]|nr:pantoate--beta-alanine ligase [bacterium]MDD5354538.1 pantoate--beta-alanine ligase [bacterium]MDD5756765.1 pantoate--beta-alanine ligase [bacterium]
MKIIRKIKLMQEYVKRQRKAGRTIGFIPTMGALHEGHLSLIRQAKKENDIVAVSIFVNPTQFGPQEDFKKYPRPLAKDVRLAKSAGASVIFNPSADEMYPAGYQTFVEVGKITQGLCGASRPGHFRGVATVVNKLFNAVPADKAYFGQKDYQQARVIQQMVKDLNIAVQVVICPIIREQDGLAMSSRNQYLNAEERKSAACLYEALKVAKAMIKSKIKETAKIKKEVRNIIESNLLAKVDYIEIVDAETLEPAKMIKGKVVIALAVYIGKTRLIDNMVIG